MSLDFIQDIQDVRSTTPVACMALDPGINGAYAVLGYDKSIITAGELPRFSHGLNAVNLAAILRSHAPPLVIIERVGSRPHQGVASTFKFGQAYGTCIGCVSALKFPLFFVMPGVWKSHFHLTGKPKDASREYATRIYPEFADHLTLKKHHGRADAILMARYALEGGCAI